MVQGDASLQMHGSFYGDSKSGIQQATSQGCVNNRIGCNDHLLQYYNDIHITLIYGLM